MESTENRMDMREPWAKVAKARRKIAELRELRTRLGAKPGTIAGLSEERVQ